jgi:hypothetical protein
LKNVNFKACLIAELSEVGGGGINVQGKPGIYKTLSEKKKNLNKGGELAH